MIPAGDEFSRPLFDNSWDAIVTICDLTCKVTTPRNKWWSVENNEQLNTEAWAELHSADDILKWFGSIRILLKFVTNCELVSIVYVTTWHLSGDRRIPIYTHSLQTHIYIYHIFTCLNMYMSVAIISFNHENLRLRYHLNLFLGPYSISQEVCTRFLLCCALLWLYIDWFSHIHQAYFTGTVAI